MSDCILWPEDHTQDNGYGWLSISGRKVYAHRWVMGEPDGQVGHLCHDRAAVLGECDGGRACPHRRCVNPEHLAVMTAGENLAASPLSRVARKFNTYCIHGHEFTAENTYVRPNNTRACKTCARERHRARS
jgi:hypothetical protein